MIGLVVSEEKIFEKVYDIRQTPSDGKSSPGLWPGEQKKVTGVPWLIYKYPYTFD
jgi:hypothetical protein